MSITPKVIKGHAHVLSIDNNLAMVHTHDNIQVGNFIKIYTKELLVITLREDESKYYRGMKFYEINFKATGAR